MFSIKYFQSKYTFYTILIPETFYCRVNYVLLSDKYLQETAFVYYIGEIVKMYLYHSVFLACLRKHKSKHTRINNRLSVEHDLYSQSDICGTEYVSVRKIVID